MARFRMRPSFVAEARCRCDDAMPILRTRVDANPDGVEGSFSRAHGVLCMCEGDRRFWSPSLDLSLEDIQDASGEDAPTESTLRVWGTFSPRPEIWTGIVFTIGTLVILSTISFFFGIAQWLTGEMPWALLVPLVAILLAVGVYLSALIGQGLSLGDMYRMRALVDTCLREAEAAARQHPTHPPDAASQL